MPGCAVCWHATPPPAKRSASLPGPLRLAIIAVLLVVAACRAPEPALPPTPAAIPPAPPAVPDAAGPTHWAGPLPARNQHPAQLTVLHLPVTSTAVLPAGEYAVRGDLAYTSLFLGEGRPGNRFRMDGEYLRASLGLRLGLLELDLGPWARGGLELGLELPMAHTSGGFLDGFLIGYHRVLGLPDQGRDRVPRGQFEIVAERDGQTVFSVDRSEAELLDVPVWLTWQLLGDRAGQPGAAGLRPARGFGLAVRAGLELPTGDQRRGYGSGGLDAGIGLLLEHRGEHCAVYAQLQHTWASSPASVRDNGYRLADVTALAVGLELSLTDNLHAYAQLGHENSTLRRLQQQEMARDQLLLWLGGRYRLGSRWSLEFAVGEDLIGYVSPDVSFWLGMSAW